MLLVGPVIWLLGSGTDAFILRFPAIVVHFVGWMFLLASLKAVSTGSGVARRRMVRGMFATWMLWFVAALGGIATLPLAFPELYCTIICLPRGWLLLPYFPYVPSVFAPVIACHAAFFLLESKFLGPLPARVLTRSALFLVIFAVGSIAIQAASLFSGWAYLLAGLTAPGYFYAAKGLRRALRDSVSFNETASGAARRSAGL
jgi:hypothetical protein